MKLLTDQQIDDELTAKFPLYSQAAQLEIKRLAERVRVETEAKNRAYSFILQSGLYSQWVEFCKFGLYGQNPHKECTEYLTNLAKSKRTTD